MPAMRWSRIREFCSRAIAPGAMSSSPAFTYEQCHLLDKAERSAWRALESKSESRAEPWAQHALAHVMLTEKRIDEGAAVLESQRGT